MLAFIGSVQGIIKVIIQNYLCAIEKRPFKCLFVLWVKGLNQVWTNVDKIKKASIAGSLL